MRARWEYTRRFTYQTTIPTGEELEIVDLTSPRRNGWELVQVILGAIPTKTGGTTEGWICIYKRPRRWWQR